MNDTLYQQTTDLQEQIDTLENSRDLFQECVDELEVQDNNNCDSVIDELNDKIDTLDEIIDTKVEQLDTLHLKLDELEF